jgi:hypothetical protein
MASERNYPATDPDRVELKELPPARVMEATDDRDYWSGGNRPFGRLFGYIQRHRVAMTVPVEADIAPSRMRFFVPRRHPGPTPDADGGVHVYERPAQRVVSAGLRGEYTRARFEQGVAAVREWLAAHPEWSAAGEPYAVYWNSPFTPGFLKRSEVHLPVAPAGT